MINNTVRCVDCPRYDKKHNSCENTGWKLTVGDGTLWSNSSPWIIKGPKTGVPMWCYKFYKKDINNELQDKEKIEET